MNSDSRKRWTSLWSPEDRAVAVIFLAALALRLYFAFVVEGGHNGFFDMKRYNDLALQGGIPYAPPPGYPLFLRMLYAAFGNLNYRAVYIAQSIISAITVLFVFRVAERVGTRRAGLIAAAVSALYPNFIVFNLITLTETIGLFFVVLLLFILTGGLEERKRSVLSAVTLCAAYFYRPSLIFFWPGVLWCVRRRRAFILVTAVIMASWVSYGTLTGKSSRRFARGIYKSYNEAQRGSRALKLKDTPLGSDDLASGTYIRNALDFIVHNKWETLDIVYYKATVLVSAGYSNYTVSKLVRGRRNIDRILYFGYLPVMILGFAGLIRMYDRRTRCLAIPMLSYLFFNILLSIFKARYRLMVEPMLLIFAALLVDERIRAAGEWIDERKQRNSA